MLTQATAAEIWECYREIAAGEKLLADMAKDAKDYNRSDDMEPRLKDAFGRRKRLELGVPSGESCHRLYGVSAALGLSVIRAHIADSRAALVRANERARIEINSEAAPADELE